MAEDAEIICPHCGKEQDNETKAGLVTYWGEGAPSERWCEFCDEKFTVREHVVRTFETSIPEKVPE